MTRLVLALVLLTGCPVRDVHLAGTPLWLVDYGLYGDACTATTPAERQRIANVWAMVLAESEKSGLIARAPSPDYKVRVCLVQNEVVCRGWIGPPVAGCAGSNAIIVSRRHPQMWLLLAGEMTNHLFARGLTHLDPLTVPEGLPGQGSGLLQDPKYQSTLTALRGRIASQW